MTPEPKKQCPHAVWSAQADGVTQRCVSCGRVHPLSSVANARLIAAAPALADALLAWIESTDASEQTGSMRPVYDAAKSALRAAGRLP